MTSAGDERETTGLPDIPSESDEDVAAAMGFGSFGAKPHLKKKRKIQSTDQTTNTAPTLPVRPGLEKGAQGDDLSPPPEGAPTIHPSRQGNFEGHLRTTDSQDGPPRAIDTKSLQQHHGHKHQESHQPSAHEKGKLPNGDWDWHALRRGVRNEHGDTAFYDASFVEDPWAALEKRV